MIKNGWSRLIATASKLQTVSLLIAKTQEYNYPRSNALHDLHVAPRIGLYKATPTRALTPLVWF